MSSSSSSSNRWKSYSSPSNIKNLNNTFANVSIDRLVLTQPFKDDIEFQKSITVQENANIVGNIYLQGNLYSQNIIILNSIETEENAIIGGNIYCNHYVFHELNNSANSYIYGNNNQFGINNDTPKATLHINEQTHPNQGNVFSVQSSQDNTRNIYLQNNTHKGLAMSGNANIATIEFSPNLSLPQQTEAKINYQFANKSLEIIAPNITQITSNLQLGNVLSNSTTQPKMTLTANPTNLLFEENNLTPNIPISFAETFITQDNSIATSYYGTQTAQTFFASGLNEKGNTTLYAGVKYQQQPNTHIPSLIITSNETANIIQCPSKIALHRYSAELIPNINTQINGKTALTNGFLLKTFTNTTNSVFSLSKQRGHLFVVGDVNNPHFSNNGGKEWQIIPNITVPNDAITFRNAQTIDQTLLSFYGRGIIEYSNNNGQTFTQLEAVSSPTFVNVLDVISTLQLTATTFYYSGTKLGGTGIINTIGTITSATEFVASTNEQSTQNYQLLCYLQTNPSTKTIYGVNSTGVYKLATTTHTQIPSATPITFAINETIYDLQTNKSNTFFAILTNLYIYIIDINEQIIEQITNANNLLKLVATENGIIAISQTEIFYCASIINEPTFTSVDLFLLNSSGNAEKLLLNSSMQYLDISIVNDDTVLFLMQNVANNTRNIVYSYIPSIINTTNNDVFFCYGGAVIDGITTVQKDLNVVGNIATQSNLIVAENAIIDGSTTTMGNLTTQSNLIVAENAIIDGSTTTMGNLITQSNLIVANNAIIDGSTTTMGNLITQSNLIVANNAIIDGSTTTTGNLTTQSNLIVANNAIIDGSTTTMGNLITQSNLIVANNSFMNGYLNVVENITTQSHLYVQNNSYFTGLATFYGDIQLYGEAIVVSDFYTNTINTISFANIGGNVIAQSNLIVSQNSIINGLANIAGNLITQSNLIVSQNSIVNGLANIAGNLITQSNLIVSQNSIINGLANIAGNLITQSNLIVSQNSIINGFSNIAGNLITQSNLIVANNHLVNGFSNIAGNLITQSNLIVSQNSIINGLANIAGNLITQSNLIVANNHLVNGLASVVGNLTTSSNLIVANNHLVNGFSNIAGNLITQSNLIVANNSFLNGSASVVGNLTTSSNLIVANNHLVNGFSNIAGNLITQSNLIVTNNAIVNGSASVVGNITTQSNLIVTNNAIVNGSASVVGNITTQSNLTVSQNANVNGIANIAGNLITRSNLIVTNNSLLNGSASVVGNLTAQSNLIVTNNSIVNGFANIAGNIRTQSNLIVSQNANVNGSTNIAGNLTTQSNLIVENNANFNGSANFAGEIYVSRVSSSNESNDEITMIDVTRFNDIFIINKGFAYNILRTPDTTIEIIDGVERFPMYLLTSTNLVTIKLGRLDANQNGLTIWFRKTTTSGGYRIEANTVAGSVSIINVNNEQGTIDRSGSYTSVMMYDYNILSWIEILGS